MTSIEQPNSIKNKIFELKSQYKESLDKSNMTILELKRENEILLSEKNIINSKYDQKNQRLEHDKNSLIEQIKNQENELFASSQKINQLVTNFKNVEPELLNLKEQLKDAKNIINDNNEQINNLKISFDDIMQKAKKATMVANKRKEIIDIIKSEQQIIENKLNISLERETSFKNDNSELIKQNLEIVKNLNISENKNNLLEKQIDQLNNEIISFNNKLDQISFELKKKDSEKNKLNLEIESRDNKNQILKNENVKLNTSLLSLNNQLSKFEEKLVSLNDENTFLKDNINQLNTKLKETESREDQYLQKIDNLNDELNITNSNLNELIKEKNVIDDKYNVDFKKYKENLETIRQESEILINKNQESYLIELENKENQLKENFESYQLKIDIQERKITELSKTFDEELRLKAKIEHDNSILNDGIEILNNQLEQQKEESLRLKEGFNLREKELDSMMAGYVSEAEELKTQLNNIKEEFDNVNQNEQKELKRLIHEKQELEENVNYLNEQIEKVKLSKRHELARFDYEINTLITENSNLKINLSKNDIELDISKQEAISLKKGIDNLRDNFDNNEQKLFNLESSYKHLNLEIHEKNNLIKEREILFNKYYSEISELKSQIDQSNDKISDLVFESNKKENNYKLEIKNLNNELKERLNTKDIENKELYEQINLLNNQLTLLSESNIDKMSSLEQNKDNLLNEILLEKNLLIESLKKENNHHINRISDLKALESKSSDILEQANKKNKENTSYLNGELEELKLKYFQSQNQVSENKIINESLKKQNKSLEEIIQTKEDKYDKNLMKNFEDENNLLKTQLDVLNKKLLEHENEKKELTNISDNTIDNNVQKNHSNSSLKEQISEIEDMYKAAFNEKVNNEDIKLSNVTIDNIKLNDDQEVDISRLEFYNDIIDENITFAAEKKEYKSENKAPIYKNNLNNEIEREVSKNQLNNNISKVNSNKNLNNINDQLEKAQESLSYLQGNKRNKQEKTDNTVFIMGGNKEIEDNWKMDLEKCLHEYGLTHQWISNSDKEILKGSGKGIIFLISQHSIQLIDSSDLIMRNTQIPSIKHSVTNLTKLKLDIIDNFVRKK